MRSPGVLRREGLILVAGDGLKNTGADGWQNTEEARRAFVRTRLLRIIVLIECSR
jgi:hypothetical protein